MDLKSFLEELKALNNLVKNLDDLENISALDQAMIKRKIENLYEEVINDYYRQSGPSPKTYQSSPETINVRSEEKEREEVKEDEVKASRTESTEKSNSESVFFFDKDKEEQMQVEDMEKEEITSQAENFRETQYKKEADEELTSSQPSANGINHGSSENGNSEETRQEVLTQEISNSTPELEELFNIKRGNDLSERLSFSPVNDILKAMGLNERIFTQNELFGNNNTVFTETVSQLNNFTTFAEAKKYLVNTVVQEYDWTDDQRREVAKNFIQLVHRRYKSKI